MHARVGSLGGGSKFMPFTEGTVARSLPNLNALRAFEAAARHLSFSLAARELLVTQSAISRQVKALETSLGVALFVRRGRAVELTPHGRDYLAVTHDAFELIEAASRRIADATRRTILTANVLPTFAMRWLIPRLSHFTEANPDIEVHMITSIAPVNFNRDDVDVAIRVGVPPATVAQHARARIDLKMVEDWKNVRADLLMPDVLVPVCSPRLLGNRTIHSPGDLFALRLLHNATREHAWPDWFAAQNVPLYAGHGRSIARALFYVAAECDRRPRRRARAESTRARRHHRGLADGSVRSSGQECRRLLPALPQSALEHRTRSALSRLAADRNRRERRARKADSCPPTS